MWQSIENDCGYTDSNFGCTEADAINRLNRIFVAHTPEFTALREFANSGDNTLTIVPGNHDAALLFPAVSQAVVKKLNAKSGRVRIMTDGYWLSRDQLIYAEHGHQIGEEANRFAKWPRPFLSDANHTYLERPWGEQFVREYYDKWERTYSIIDNIAEELGGIKYAVAAEGLPKAALATLQFAKFFFLQVSWNQFGGVLGKQGVTPKWDILRVRQQGNTFLLESIRTGDPLRATLENAIKTGQISFGKMEFTEAQINAICDKRAVIHKAQTESGMKPTIARCPESEATLGAIAQYLFRSRDSVYGDHLTMTYELLRKSKKADQAFKVFVYSHTHRAEAGFRPLSNTQPEWDPIVVNTGAWQRVITTEQLDAHIERHKLSEGEVLPTFGPENLPECYAAIVIKPYSDTPVPVLQYWTRDKDWQFAQQCSGDIKPK
jgi:hypothetical protein